MDAYVAVAVAMDEGELVAQLDCLAALGRTEQISDRASNELIAAVRGFIQQGPGAV